MTTTDKHENKSRNIYRKFLYNMFLIGLTGYGGGSSLIPLIEKKIVGIIDTEENLNSDIVIAGITPGAMPVEIASGIGKRNFGVMGMIAGPIMIAFPGSILAILLLILFSNLQSNYTSVLGRV